MSGQGVAPHSDDFLSSVSRRAPGLSPQLRRAADYLLRHPEEVAMRGLRDVAHEIGVAPPTLTRLARALDCKDYEEMRDLCRRKIRDRGYSFADRAQSLQSRGDGAPFAAQQARAAIRNIERTLADLDIEAMRRAADRLMATRRIHLYGALSAAPIVDYLAYLGAMVRGDWSVMTGGGHRDASELADIGSDAVVIVVASTPCAARTVRFARACRERGAWVLAITDNAASPLARHADQALFAVFDSPQFFPSHVSALMIVEALTGMLVRRGGDAAVARVRRIEKTRERLGDLWRQEVDERH